MILCEKGIDFLKKYLRNQNLTIVADLTLTLVANLFMFSSKQTVERDIFTKKKKQEKQMELLMLMISPKWERKILDDRSEKR